jgi:hypothetical protein
MEAEPSRRNRGGEPWIRNHGGSVDDGRRKHQGGYAMRRNFGGGIMEKELRRRNQLRRNQGEGIMEKGKFREEKESWRHMEELYESMGNL